MWIMTAGPLLAVGKPTGKPLELSNVETEQPIPLAILTPDGKTAQCVLIRLHWNPKQDVGPNDEATSFDLDIKPDAPGASIFTAQLWSASLASALVWQQPWSGARWKVFNTPTCDGSGIDAALAVGMISTASRRLYPKDTVVIGALNPDGSLGAVSHLVDRIDAAQAAGIKRIIIPSVQRFDTDSTGQVLNIVRYASEEQVQCIPADNLAEATETVMNDPLPDSTVKGSLPKYSNDVETYIDTFAQREQSEMNDGLRFAPQETDVANYPQPLAVIWRRVFSESKAGEQAYQAGEVYTAYRLFAQANGDMHGVNTLGQQNDPAAFDVKAALVASDDLRQQLHDLMNPPSIDKDELESAVLVAEMADWAYGLDAALEGAQLVTKQTFSQRSDATPAEQARAREEILFTNEQVKYLLQQADFYQGLLAHAGNDNPMPVDENAAHLLPQLIPAQLATAHLFTDEILPRANEMRDGLLFDSRLAAYVNVLRETKTAWDERLRRKEMENETEENNQTPAPADGTKPAENAAGNATKPNATMASGDVGFNPGNTFAPPHTMLTPSSSEKKISDVAACLIWVNHDCEIAALNEKYLRLNGTIDPTTHEWHTKDRAKLDELLQMAELGARCGVAVAQKAELDPSVLAMIYERASQDRLRSDDTAALAALRNYWRCALLGNMCWQLAHTRKAQPVDAGNAPPTHNGGKAGQANASKPGEISQAIPVQSTTQTAPSVSSNKPNPSPSTTPAPAQITTTNTQVAPAKTAASGPTTINSEANIPVAHIAKPEDFGPKNGNATNAPPASPVPPSTASASASSTNIEANIPVAHIAKPEDLGPKNGNVTNAPPASPVPPSTSPPKTTVTNIEEANIPVAHIAKPEDYNGTAGGNSTNAPPNTNNAPIIGPPPPTPANGNKSN